MSAQAIVVPRFFGPERPLRRLLGVVSARQAGGMPGTVPAEPRRGAASASRNPLPGMGSAFRLLSLRAVIARFPHVSAGTRPHGMRFRNHVETQSLGSSWILQSRPLEVLIRHRQLPSGRWPAFSLLHSALLASPDPHG